MRAAHVAVIAAFSLVSVACFNAGIAYSRAQVRAVADELDRAGVNTFTKCLLEGWEASGELDADRKGKRHWRLVE